MSDIVERLRTAASNNHIQAERGTTTTGEILTLLGCLSKRTVAEMHDEAADEIERLRSLLKDSEWRDISTAPKDGTEIIIAGSDWSSCASWGETKYHGSGWLDACDLAHKDGYAARPLSGVTSWMPLPLPPSEDYEFALPPPPEKEKT